MTVKVVDCVLYTLNKYAIIRHLLDAQLIASSWSITPIYRLGTHSQLLKTTVIGQSVNRGLSVVLLNFKEDNKENIENIFEMYY